jgi:hypothetical protein
MPCTCFSLLLPPTHNAAEAVQVPVKEVTDKLKSQGIDLDNNRFLILQV